MAGKWIALAVGNIRGLSFAIGLVFCHLLLLSGSRAAQRHLCFAFHTEQPNLLGLVAFFLINMNSSRVPYLEKYIRQATTQMSFMYYFANWSKQNLTSPPSLYPPDKYRRLVQKALANGREWNQGVKSPDLLAKLILSIDFFTETTFARWFWCGTDDVIINFPLFRQMMK
jgi:hypothetical protein